MLAFSLALLKNEIKKRMTRADYAHLGLAQGLSLRETMTVRVGLLYDLWETYLDIHFPKRERD
jgi:hypothetical protein